MTIAPLKMPKWGLSMQEGTLGAWRVREGAAIAEGDELVDVETSKIVNAFEATTAGNLRRIVAQEGETLPVGALLAVLAPPEIGEAEIDAFIADFQSRFVPESEDEGGGLESAFVPIGAERALRTVVVGEGEPAVLLLHGFGGDLENWAAVQAALSTSHRVIAIDLPGHGLSTKTLSGASPADLAADVARAVDALGAKSVHLVGHSLGGAIALAFALAYPERTASLAMVCPAGLPGGAPDAGYLDRFLAARRARDLAKALEALFSDPSLATRDMAEAVLKARRLDGAEDALAQIRAAMASPAFSALGERVREVRARTLVIVAALDRIVGSPDQAKLPPQAKVVLIDGVGHMPHAERPADVISVLREHIG